MQIEGQRRTNFLGLLLWIHLFSMYNCRDGSWQVGQEFYGRQTHTKPRQKICTQIISLIRQEHQWAPMQIVWIQRNRTKPNMETLVSSYSGSCGYGQSKVRNLVPCRICQNPTTPHMLFPLAFYDHKLVPVTSTRRPSYASLSCDVKVSMSLHLCEASSSCMKWKGKR